MAILGHGLCQTSKTQSSLGTMDDQNARRRKQRARIHSGCIILSSIKVIHCCVHLPFKKLWRKHSRLWFIHRGIRRIHRTVEKRGALVSQPCVEHFEAVVSNIVAKRIGYVLFNLQNPCSNVRKDDNKSKANRFFPSFFSLNRI